MVKLCLPFIALATLSNAVNAFTLEDALFFEDFDGSEDVFASGKWVKSLNAKYANQPVMVKAPTKTTPGYENDCGVQLTQEMKHYGFSSKLSNPVEFTGEDLVIQYELKTEELLACGGAYIKLLRDAEHMNLEDLNNESPYSIMFGPDKCGTSSKVHFIVQHQNPVSKVWSEHHFNGDIKPKIDRGYHQYSLRIKNDSTFEISLDNKPIASGSLLRDLSPPINPSEEIDDPIDFKPADWVDVELISDPTAVRPEDWDESQPRKIPSADKSKPADWDESVPARIPDPEISKPADWDDEEDGEWEAPEIANPVCETKGCGPWAAPLVDNPLYKGKWSAPKIPNPEYKGAWAPRKIKNVAYFQDPSPYHSLAPINALAVEVWTTTAGILFDNFLITRSALAAFEYARDTTAAKSRTEKDHLKAEEKAREYAERMENIANGNLLQQAQGYAEIVAEYLKDHPMIIIDAAIVVVLTMIYFLVFGWTKKEDKPVAVKKTEKKPEKKAESDSETETVGAIESKE